MAILEEWIAIEEMYCAGEQNPAIQIPENVCNHSQNEKLSNPLDNAGKQENTNSITSISYHGKKEIMDNFEDHRNSIRRTSTSINESWNFDVSQRKNSNPEPDESNIDVGTEFIEDIDRQKLQTPIDYFMDLTLDLPINDTTSRPQNGSNLPESVNSNIHKKSHNPDLPRDLPTEKADFHAVNITANIENVDHNDTEQRCKNEDLIHKIGKLHTITKSECSTVGSTSAANLRYGFFNNEQSRETNLSRPRIFTNMKDVDYSNLQIPFPIYPQNNHVKIQNQELSTFKTQIPGVHNCTEIMNDGYNSTTIACIPAMKYSENERNHITITNQCFSNFETFLQFYEFCEFVSWYLKIPHQSADSEADSHCQVFSSNTQPNFQQFQNSQSNQHESSAKFTSKSIQYNSQHSFKPTSQSNSKPNSLPSCNQSNQTDLADCERSSDQHATHKFTQTSNARRTTKSNQKNQQQKCERTLRSTALSTINFGRILKEKIQKGSKIKRNCDIRGSVNKLVEGASLGKKKYYHEKKIPKVTVENQKLEHNKPSANSTEPLTRKRKSKHFKNTKTNKKFIDEFIVEEYEENEEIWVDNAPRKINFSLREFDYYQTPKRKSKYVRNK